MTTKETWRDLREATREHTVQKEEMQLAVP